jgi:ABC-2 type transport system ATP-binding protein
VGILHTGQLKEVKSVAELTHTDFRWVTFQFRQPVPASRVATLSGVSDVSVGGNKLKLRLIGDFDPLLRAVSDQYIVDIEVKEPSLEEVFLTYYGDTPTMQNNHRREKEKVTA